MELVLAHVYPNTLEIPMNLAGPSVFTTRTVPPTEHALEINAWTHVQAHAAQMPIAKS